MGKLTQDVVNFATGTQGLLKKEATQLLALLNILKKACLDEGGRSDGAHTYSMVLIAATTSFLLQLKEGTGRKAKMFRQKFWSCTLLSSKARLKHTHT